MIVGLLLVSVLVVAGLIALTNRGKVVIDPDPDPIKPVKTIRTFERFWPPEYIAVGDHSADQIYPERVRRTTDQVFFKRFADGIYLPEGYEIENRADLAADGWPRVMITRDGVDKPPRFVRIEGEIGWMMGAWDADRRCRAVRRPRAPGHPHRLLHAGDRGHQRPVRGLSSDKTETSPGPSEWEQVVIESSSKAGEDPEEAKKHPVVSISHKMAQLYADYMNGQLPTEAQWEYAARSRGQKLRYVWGNTPARSREHGQHRSQDKATTAPVGIYPKDKTEEGLFDMTGNVQEMCRDVWKPYKEEVGRREGSLRESRRCPLSGIRDPWGRLSLAPRGLHDHEP